MRKRLVATFNGGFPLETSNAGLIYRGKVKETMVNGIATVVEYRDGRIDIVRWHQGPGASAERLVREAEPAADHRRRQAQPEPQRRPRMGRNRQQRDAGWRSGLGIDSPRQPALRGGELPRPPNAGGGTLRADPDRLTQVVRNLLANARRHAGQGGRVALSATAAGRCLTIRIDDDGPGIDPAERERVFDRFHRSQGSRDRQSGGSGLGLAIARSIVELHGGRIWIEESPLRGARVALELASFAPEPGVDHARGR